ncbi:MAG TPA: helix-turn-helix domain-containing protein [Thermoplasmata archaeon]|nr:helix-turn-helix domain-containing protein [Thermoplasmata archaeon]
MERAAVVRGGFSSQKRELLLLLKRRPDCSLTEVAHDLGISKVAALRHLTALESLQLVERSYRNDGVGRPRVHFRLGGDSNPLFPEAYTQMSVCALRFIEERMGRSAVRALLQQRAHEVADQGRPRMRGKELGDRVTELAQIRQEGGYMAEVAARRSRSLEMLEHNCPILAIAQQFPEACEVERKLFESMLSAQVDVSHRVVAGDPVCRFLIHPRRGPA